MSKIALILVIMGIVSVLAVGSYAGFKAYQKHKAINDCVTFMLSMTTDAAQLAVEEPVAKEYCTCVYEQMLTGLPRGFAELGCAFDILIQLEPSDAK
jgi:hypothetical protein